MKRNVDLTENRFFSNNNSFNGILIPGLIASKKFPWSAFVEKIETDEDFKLKNQIDAIIVVGDKKTRAKTKFYREMDSLDYCDCCGKRMNLIPWDKEIGVCHQCHNYYLEDKDKCKWRKKETIRNAVIR